MTPIKSNRTPLTKRISALAITAAACTFAILSPEAQAAPAKPTNEYKALDAALRTAFPTKTVETATAEELQVAVTNAINAAPQYKPGNIAGEALKYGTDEEAGDDIADALLTAVSGDLQAVVDAIKRTAKGKDPTVRLVPNFAAFALPDGGDNSAALALAKRVISTKPGAGAVIGGRAQDLAKAGGTQQAQIEQLVKDALVKTAGISAAAQDIAKWSAAELAADFGDTAALALNVSIVPTNVPLAQKIVVGAVAGDPLNGGPIVDKVLDQDNNALPKLKSGILPFAKAAAAVADIEEIAHIAVAIGKQIAKPSGTKTAILFSKAAGVVKALAGAIIAKATTANAQNTIKNKQDETAEVAAFMVGHILNQATIASGSNKGQVNAKSAPAKILAIITSAVNAAKSAKVQTANPGLYADLTVDVTASVVETLGELRDHIIPDSIAPDKFFDDIIAYIRSKAKQIAGKAGTQSQIETAIDLAKLSGLDGRFEHGTPDNQTDATVRDETDNHIF
jgi:hypothetical protein